VVTGKKAWATRRANAAKKNAAHRINHLTQNQRPDRVLTIKRDNPAESEKKK
jgi:hypothetical protein